MEKTLKFFRDQTMTQKMIRQTEYLLETINRPVTLMEVCGTHTMAISRWGLRKLLPKQIRLLSGPGCPVCVTPQETIDYAIEISKARDVMITTFGDMVKVPGSKGTLASDTTTIVYSPTDALAIAAKNQGKRVVFVGVGFETTAPTIAATLKKAKTLKDLRNFFVISAFKLVPPALMAIAKMRQVDLSGLILPGHVSTIIGSRAYEFLARDFKMPCAITGFEPIDILEAIIMILEQIRDNKPQVEIQYQRVVHSQGNLVAQKMMQEVFEICDSRWRGLGKIPESGLRLKKEFVQFSVEQEFPIRLKEVKEAKGCLCGLVLTGAKIPFDCELFGKTCTPSTPIGPCMVSSEGSCAAYYKYERV